MQKILTGFHSLENALEEVRAQRYMLICDSSFAFLPIKEAFNPVVAFDHFTPNPLYEDVCKGVELFKAHRCDALVAVGGGSTIDVAKCIKLFCAMDASRNFLQQEYQDSGVPIIAIPTTAGTGSESTRYAVIYFNGVKQSITHDSIVPDYAILEPTLLKTLPIYQKKCTMLDALCQGMESFWSINSNEESMGYSKTAIGMILNHWQGYIEENDDEAAKHIMLAANVAGRAINITQTTAPHAMSYKLTSLYGLPHGHAVALCLPEVWQFMLEHPERCIDPRGKKHLTCIFNTLAQIMGVESPEKGLMLFRDLLKALGMFRPKSVHREEELNVLTSSVNALRLRNNPVALDEESIRIIYNDILL